MRFCDERPLHKRVSNVFSSFEKKEKIKIPLAPFKKVEICSPFYEGGWGDLIFFMLC